MGSRTATALAALVLAAAIAGPAAAAETLNVPPTEKDWLALSRLPDWSGVWTPDATDQVAQMGCLPYGMPALMMIPHNAMEILFTPGRITILGESDGNRLRRIYTDGRGHPEDPDLTFMGHSVGHWEGQTLVVDTVGILPQAWIALGEAVGNPNNGDMHIVERIHIGAPDTLLDELEITAPKVFTRPWKTTRKFYRQRSPKYDIVEGACTQGDFKASTDAKGNAIYVPVAHGADGGLAPTGR